MVRAARCRQSEHQQHKTEEAIGMRSAVEQTMGRRRIVITETDMSRLRALVRDGRTASPLDLAHLDELDRELDRAEIVDDGDVPADVVTMQSTVRVLDLDSRRRADYTIVFPEAADIERRHLSILAPVGTALLGYRAGDVVEWMMPGGPRRLQIESILFQPEAAGVTA
jgi:regulator of nucleoside diphosphate kinase